ncbi:AAA family ATPase [Spirosoma areae]
MSNPQNKDTNIPARFIDPLGGVWVDTKAQHKKPWIWYVDKNAEATKTDDGMLRRYKTPEEAIRAFVNSDAAKGFTPPLFDMTDEEKANSAHTTFEEREEKPNQSERQQQPEEKTKAAIGIDYSALLAAAMVLPTDHIPQPPVCLSIGVEDQQSIVGTLGNISAVMGKAKAKKTFAVSFAVAAAVACKLILNRITGRLPPKQRTVLLFDTEQSRYHVLRVVQRICALAGVAEPPNLVVYSLRAYSPDERLALIDYALNHTPGVGLAVIDGVRDLQDDPILDAKQSNKIITCLLKWTTELNIHAMVVLHLNKTDGNARGHIGSELNNKAETVITVTKDRDNKEISIVAPEYCRDKDFEPFAFSVNEQGIPFLVEEWQADQRTASRKETKADEPPKEQRTITPSQLPAVTHEVILRRAFADVMPGKYGVTCHRIKAAAEYFGHKFGDNKAKEFMTYYKDAGWVLVNGTTYTLNLPSADSPDLAAEEAGLV